MGIFGMTVDVASSIHSRMVSSAARGLLDSAANELHHVANVSSSPLNYGVQPELGTILDPGSVVTARSIASQLYAMQSRIDSFANELLGHIDSQRDASRALGAASHAANAVGGLFGAAVVRRYTTRVGVQYGPLFRHPNDPRIHWRNQGFSYNTQQVFTGNNYTSRWVNANAATRLYGRVNQWASHVGSRLPVGFARALGPIGIIVGGVASYSNGYDAQIAADQGRGFSAETAQSRAQVRGVSEAVGSTVGAVALGAVGAAVGGPIGAVVGGWLGGMVGGWLGGLVGEAING